MILLKNVTLNLKNLGLLSPPPNYLKELSDPIEYDIIKKPNTKLKKPRPLNPPNYL